MATPIPTTIVQEVWDPEVVLAESFPALSGGAVWISEGYTVPVGEVIEIYSVEIVPPVDTASKVVNLGLVEILINGEEYPSVKLNTLMSPYSGPQHPGKPIWLGKPILHKPITGELPPPHEATAIKAKEGDLVQVRVTALEPFSSSGKVILRFARCRGQSKLQAAAGAASYTVSLMLDTDMYSKGALPVTITDWDTLPGGMRQGKPQIFPWRTFAANKTATTPNRWYDFTYPATVTNPWQTLSWNLVNKERAYYITHIGVESHANAKALRLYVEGRATNPEIPIPPYPDTQELLPAVFKSLDLEATVRWAGPTKLRMPFLAHGIRGGVQIVDTGTSIPADGVRIDVYGTYFVLK
ncbi:MAG: hypothetical protein QXU69_11730 [Thermofilaceae archaeon]